MFFATSKLWSLLSCAGTAVKSIISSAAIVIILLFIVSDCCFIRFAPSCALMLFVMVCKGMLLCV